MAEFRMPSLGADMERGRVVEWHASPGQAVTKGAVLVDVATEKGVFEIASPETGELEAILVPTDESVPVGTVLARLRVPGEAAAAEAPSSVAPDASAGAGAAPSPAGGATVAPTAAPPGVRASPAARQAAQARGVALDRVVGSGPDGVITLADVERAAAAAASPGGGPAGAGEAGAGAATPVTMRHAIATAVTRSKREIPHYYLALDIDLTAATAWIAARNADRPPSDRIVPTAVLAAAVARGLARFPQLNGMWAGDHVEASPVVHLGLAVSLRSGGLIVPVLHDAHLQPVDALMARLRDVVERARTGQLTGADLVGASATLTSLGEDGATTVHAIIHPPQVAMVGMGRISDRPWVVDGAVVARRIVTATLSADHRATDGQYGSRFLAHVAELLQHPEAW